VTLTLLRSTLRQRQIQSNVYILEYPFGFPVYQAGKDRDGKPFPQNPFAVALKKQARSHHAAGLDLR
jgi:hypothetical protein